MTNRPVFGTVSFYNAMADALNDDPKWLEQATNISYSFVYRYNPPIDKTFFVNFDSGKVTEVSELSSVGERTADFVISAEPEHWQAVLQKKLAPTMAILTKKMKVDGNQGVLFKHMKPFGYLLQAMTKLNPVFPGDAE